MRTAKTLIRLGGCPGWSESSLGLQSLCWFWHVAAHFVVVSQKVLLGCFLFHFYIYNNVICQTRVGNKPATDADTSFKAMQWLTFSFSRKMFSVLVRADILLQHYISLTDAYLTLCSQRYSCMLAQARELLAFGMTQPKLRIETDLPHPMRTLYRLTY